MKVFHIEFAKVGMGLSGGEKCMVEIIRYFKSMNLKNVLLTTDNGKELYLKLGLVEDENLTFIVIPSYWSEKYHLFFSYVIRVFYFIKVRAEVIKMIDEKNDILMCHSEFFPNTIPAYTLTKFFKKKPIYWFHMLAPDVFKGYSGHFTKKFHIPNLAIVHYKLNQWLFKFFSHGSKIITVNPYYESLFKKQDAYTLKKFGGESLYVIKKYSGVGTVMESPNLHKKYDIAFIGRFHAQKGLLEIPKILSILKEKKRDIKLLLIGGGSADLEKEFFSEIRKRGLEDNVEYLGFISSNEKFEHLQNSKIFIFPSYYESFGQVALEAMANGLPVVAYDLPVYVVFEKGMIKVPILDNEKFAYEIMSLLENPDKLLAISNDALKYASTFSWEKTGEEIYQLVLSM